MGGKPFIEDDLGGGEQRDDYKREIPPHLDAEEEKEEEEWNLLTWRPSRRS